MRHVVIVIDVSIAMAMRDLLEPAREVALTLADNVARSADHRLSGVVAVSSTARPISLDELAHIGCDFEYGVDLDSAFELARHELGDQEGRIALISSLDFHHRTADGRYIAIATADSLAEGRDTLAAWLDRRLPLDLLLCSSEQGRVHGERVRRIFRERGARLVDLERGRGLFDTYLAALAG